MIQLYSTRNNIVNQELALWTDQYGAQNLSVDRIVLDNSWIPGDEGFRDFQAS